MPSAPESAAAVASAPRAAVPGAAISGAAILADGAFAARASGPVLLAWCCGLAAVQALPELPPGLHGWWLAAALAALAGGVARCAARRLAAIVLGSFAAGCAGFALSAAWAQQRIGAQLDAALAGRDIAVVGRVEGLPQATAGGQRFVLIVEAVEGSDSVLPQRVLLTQFAPRPREDAVVVPVYRGGERWRLTVRLKPPYGNVNPGGFDYEAWLLERAIGAIGYVRHAPPPQRLGEAEGARAWLDRRREAIRDRLRASLGDASHAGVVVALAIGDQQAIDEQGWALFNRTGTTHLMSISGLHVTMFAALAAWLVALLWRRVPWLAERLATRRAAALAGASAGLAYALLAGFGIPAQRTVCMLGVAALALAARRAVSVRRILLLALAAVLTIDPWAVLAPGFWLSFGAVAALLFAASALSRRHDGAEGAQAGLPASGGGDFAGAGGVSDGSGKVVGAFDSTAMHASGDVAPAARSAWRGCLARLAARAGDALRAFGIAQWAATLATLPLIAMFFGRLSLVSPLANALAIPLIGFLVAPLAVLAALLPFAWPAELAHALLAPLIDALEAMSAHPLAVLHLPAIGLAALLLALAGALCLLAPRGLPVRLAGALMLLPALWPAVERPVPGEATVTLFDVGHGLAVLVRTAGHALLFDAGPAVAGRFDAGARIVVPALRSLGVERLDLLLLSHEDSDHAGGAASVLRELPVAALAGSLPATHPLLAGAPPQRRCAAGERWVWDGVAFEMLHPPAKAYDNPRLKRNRLSCVLRIDNGRQAMLLTADLEAADEAAALQGNPGAFAASVLQVPHQGSKGSSTARFVAAVGAREVLFPVGYRNRYGHPHPEVVARYAASGARLWRSDRDGALTVRLGDAVAVDGWRARVPRYWRRGATIAAPADGEGEGE